MILSCVRIVSLAIAIVPFAASRFSASAAAALVDDPNPTWAVRIVFGTEDKEPTDWSGKITGPADLRDRIQLEAWRFAPGQGDQLQPKQHAWKVQTRLGVAPFESTPVQVPGRESQPVKQIPWPVGVTVIGRGAEPDRLAVETARGNFEINVRDLRWGVATKPAASVRVERTVLPVAVGNRGDQSNVHDDFPSLLSLRNGGLELAWLSFDEKEDRILTADWHRGDWTAPNQISPFGRPRDANVEPPPGDHAAPALIEDHTGTHWCFFSQSGAYRWKGSWGIQMRFWNLDVEPRQDVTGPVSGTGAQIHSTATSSSDGSIVVAWQGSSTGQSDILARRIRHAKATDLPTLSEPVTVSNSPANDWMPSLAADSEGTVYIAWDSYDAGNYDVLLRSLNANNELGPIHKIAATPLAEMNASIACDPRGRVWIAYDEGTAAWGKDYGFWSWIDKWPQGTRLYEQRRFRVRVLDGDRLLEPADPFESLPQEFREFSEQPIMRIDAHGSPWVFFRHRTAKTPREDGWAAGGWWELYAIRYDGDRWSDPIPFPRSMGRQSQPSAVAATKDGFAIAWVTDGRSFAQPADGIRTRLHTGIIDLDRVGPAGSTPRPPVLKPYSPPDLSGLTVKNIHVDEPGDLKRIRDYRIEVGGKKLAIYRGELHRHTEISGDGVGDGSLTDFYRYALDAASLDFAMVTDHGIGGDRDYPWWRTQKSNDMYAVAGRFVPMYGYERSIKYPWGHRNIIWTERGHKTLPQTKAAPKPDAKNGEAAKKAAAEPADDDTTQLYNYLRKTGGIATLHTSASDQGTNWETGFDPELEPLVEIFQGFHTSYEGPGTPLAIDDKTAIVHGAYRPAGFVWNALDKGYRLGFQASSDHIATHNSYACVWAESLDRKSLVEAMKKRHSYAATDNIILDVRSGEHMTGDEFAAAGPITLDVFVRGTAPLAAVQVIRNREIVYSHAIADSSEAKFRWSDMQPRDSTSYYYIRVQQHDRQMAWSSPMWITKK